MGCARASRAPNVLLVSLDTLRADRLGCDGYARDTTPSLDRLAREHAVRFAHATAEAPWTLPSHVTMLTGLHPWTHGVRLPDQAPGSDVRMLAERLTEHGYTTFAVTDGGWLSEPWGFARGFGSFHAQDVDIDQSVEEVLQWLRFERGKGPWFGFLHTYDVHCPYDPPPPYRGRYASPQAEPIEVAGRCGNPDFNAMELTEGQARFLSDRYDEDVRRVDEALGKLLAAFDALDLWRDTVLIVTSDHGEEFLEHGQIGHERTLESEVTSVPLLIAAPGIAAGVSDEFVGLADVVPTVLELAGLEGGRLDGRSLVPLLRGRADPGRPARVVSELAWQRELVSATSRDGHVVLDFAPGTEGGDPALRAELLGMRARMLEAGYKPGPVERGERAAELRSLGY